MRSKRLITALLAVWLLCPLLGTASAHVVPDMSKKGSITVNMVYKEKPVKGGTLSAYYVGCVQENDGNYSFIKTPDMASFPGDYSDLDSPELVKEIAAYVKAQKLDSCAQADNMDGKAVFSGLELGLYLIVQTTASKGFVPVSPFLVSVPINLDGHYVYDITAEEKFQLYQKPKPTTPTDPTDDQLPQTGQLNWPIPVLATAGLLVFSVGWLLRFGKKKGSHEK